MTTKYEYRINKRGAECFRTTDPQKVLERFKELDGKHKGIYTMQCRNIRLDRYGMPYDRDWTAWRKFPA